jgi:hypothetical protein
MIDRKEHTEHKELKSYFSMRPLRSLWLMIRKGK